MEHPLKPISNPSMKIALIGYGKMGRMVERAAFDRGHTIISRIDPHGPHPQIEEITVGEADVCIDFSHPESAVQNISKIAKLKKSLVVGTTGWYDRLAEVKSLIEEEGVGLLYSSNFAIGVHLFLRLAAQAAALFNAYGDYDVAGMETHHNAKADAPSGTGIEMGKRVLANMPRKKKIITALPSRALTADEMHIASLRCGHIPGTHTLHFDSPFDTITLTHTARSRESFARGAVAAAEWLIDKKGCYTIEDMLCDS